MSKRSDREYRQRRRRRGRRKKLPGWVIAPILGAVVLVVFGLSKIFGGNANAVSLQVVEARRESVKESFHTSGVVVSGKSKTFYSPVNAPVKENRAKVGEPVKKGEKLIVFDTANLDRDNKNSQLNTLSAKYTSQDAKEQSSRAKTSMEKAKKQEKAAISELKSQIKKKESEIKKLKKAAQDAAGKDAENAGKADALQKKMSDNLDSQSASRTKKENAERQLENISDTAPDREQTKAQLIKEAEEAASEIGRLEREYRALEQELRRLGEGGGAGAASQALAQAEQELEALKGSLAQAENSRQTGADAGLTDAQLNNMKVSENIAQLAELTTEELLKKGKEGIKAEFDGIISDVKAPEGSDAVQGGELFTLVSNRDVGVELEVSAGDFEKLVPDGKAVVTMGRNIYQGTLTSVNKIALANEKGNPVIGAKVRIDNPDDDICIGVSAKVNMTVAEKEDVLCLPNEVINTAADGDFVYIIRDGTVEKRKVEVGIMSTGMSEIVSGLKEGDQVVSEMSDSIKDGMKATAVSVSDDGGEEKER